MKQYKIVAAMLVAAITGGTGVWYMFKTGPQARERVWSQKDLRTPKTPLGVLPIGYGDETIEAMNLWNDAAGCRVFSIGTDVVVQGDTGEPCGDIELHEPGHAATSYQCNDGYEILIAKPGDLRDQLYIIAHELGHVLGLDDDGRISKGVMNQYILVDKTEGEFIKIRPSDKDIAAIKERFCK